jgi:hypothetical protein
METRETAGCRGRGLPAARSCTRLAVDPYSTRHTSAADLPMWCPNNTHKNSLSNTAMVLEAGYPSTTGFRKVVKATILVRKKPGMSDEAFIEHYNHVHAQMAAPVLQKHNVITYSLVGYLCYPAVDVQRGCRLSDCFVCVCRHIASSEIERS